MTIEEAARELDLELVVVFGSQARSGAGRDFDLAVQPRAGGCRLDTARELVRRTQRADLDVVWLPSSSWLLLAEVARDGQVLYEAEPGAFRELQLVAALRRADSAGWRRAQAAFVDDFLQGRRELNEDLIRERLALMAQSLSELEPVLASGCESFIAEPMRHHTGERLLELLVECAAGINTEVGRSAGIAPSDYYSSFFTLVSANWLDSETARKLADLASLRNVIIHQYQRVDLGDLFGVLTSSIPDWKAYLSAVRRRLADP